MNSSEPRLIGCARVSTDDQDLSLQIDALTGQGIPQSSIFMDKLHADKSLEIDDICKTLRISRSTFYRCVRL